MPANPPRINPKEWMTSHRAALDDRHRVLRARERYWSWARLVTFLAAAVIWYPLRGDLMEAVLAPVGCLVLFGLSVWRHGIARRRRFLTVRSLEIASESLKRCGGRVVLIRPFGRPLDSTRDDVTVPTVTDAGPTFALTAQERDDLDFYASPVGVFGLLNRTSSVLGARRLRDWLESPCLSAERIAARRASVEWFVDHPIERTRLMGAAAALRSYDQQGDGFLSAVHDARPLPSPGLVLALVAWSLPSLVIFLAALWYVFLGNYRAIVVLLVLFAVNWAMSTGIRRALRSAIEPWRNLRPMLLGFAETAEEATEDLPEDGDLARVRAAFAATVESGSLRSLYGRIAWTEAGGMMHDLSNYVFFYDVHVARAILHCVLNHREEITRAAGALVELEALTSLACFAWEQPHVCRPEFVQDRTLSIRGGAHPLIDPGDVITNDVTLTPSDALWIITGSNMAGKSTYLRMIGVNVLLAQIGSFVVAREMRMVPVKLVTDLRARDDLAKNESYFLAEVRQLHRMLEPAVDAAPVFGLIDEPLRGTNSQDRIAAGLAVLGHLIRSQNFFLVATHEHQFTALADGAAASNHHFREDLTESGPVFDYRLRSGPARDRNALRILEREGYPPSILARAYAWLDRPQSGDT